MSYVYFVTSWQY